MDIIEFSAGIYEEIPLDMGVFMVDALEPQIMPTVEQDAGVYREPEIEV